MKQLREELSRALEELEAGDEDEAHDVIENHLEKALKVRGALEHFLEDLDRHVDHLDELSNRTQDWDIASVRETADKLREEMDERSRLEEDMRKLEKAFGGE
jgi:DNA-binding GntR family transcriptional regulator